MSDTTQPGAESAPEQVNVVTIPGDETYISPSSAGRALSKARRGAQPADTATEKPAGAETATPQESTAQAEDATPATQPSGETEGKPEPEAELSPIEAPKSWTKDEKERFKSLPRETQEYLATREQERDREIRRSQNEAAEKLKGLTAKEQAVEQARQQYESALPILLQNLQTAMAGEFSDIKTMADVQRMATEDWPRYIRWDAQQKQVAAVQQELQGAEQRRNQEKVQKFSEFARAEDEKLAEHVPELADREKAGKLQSSAIALLKDIGFSEDELAQSYNGQKDLSLRDHRIQRLIVDGIRYREMQENAKKVQAKSLPPVQRPGTAQNKNAGLDAEIQALDKQIERASGNKQMQLLAKRQGLARRVQAH